MSDFIALIAFVLFVPIASVLIAHGIINRVVSKSPQVLAILAILVGAIPYTIVLKAWPLPFNREAIFYLYFLLVYFGYAYTYFHFFNMSETSRRARMIGALYEGRIKTVKDLDHLFVDQDMVSVRLERLESLGQVKAQGARYVSIGRVFPWAAWILFMVGRLLGRPWPAMRDYLKERR